MVRSFLFVPSNNPGMIQNAHLFDADGIIFDLEDACLIDEKESALILLNQYLKTHRALKPMVCVRMNQMQSHYFDDEFSALASQIDAIILPKASVSDVEDLSKRIDEANLSVKIIPIIESAISLLEVEAIAKFEKVTALLLGAEDLCAAMDISRSKQGTEILYARSKIALCAAAYDILSIDTPFIDITDEAGLIEDVVAAKALGMHAKACIHPNQIASVNRILSPSQEEINQALRIVEAAKHHKDKAAFNLDSKMVDAPIIKKAQKTLDAARKIGLLK